MIQQCEQQSLCKNPPKKIRKKKDTKSWNMNEDDPSQLIVFHFTSKFCNCSSVCMYVCVCVCLSLSLSLSLCLSLSNSLWCQQRVFLRDVIIDGLCCCCCCFNCCWVAVFLCCCYCLRWWFLCCFCWWWWCCCTAFFLGLLQEKGVYLKKKKKKKGPDCPFLLPFQLPPVNSCVPRSEWVPAATNSAALQ